MAIVAVLLLTGCAGNVFEQKTKVYNDAVSDLAKAINGEEIEAIVNAVDAEIDAIDESEEMKAYEALVDADDAVALKEFEIAKKACKEAQSAYRKAVLKAAAKELLE